MALEVVGNRRLRIERLDEREVQLLGIRLPWMPLSQAVQQIENDLIGDKQSQ